MGAVDTPSPCGSIMLGRQQRKTNTAINSTYIDQYQDVYEEHIAINAVNFIQIYFKLSHSSIIQDRSRCDSLEEILLAAQVSQNFQNQDKWDGTYATVDLASGVLLL